MPRFIKVGDFVELRKDLDGFFKGDWGKVVLIDDGEYHVAMFGDKRDCPVFTRGELKLMPESFKPNTKLESSNLFCGTKVDTEAEFGDVYECSIDELFAALED